MWKEIHCGLSWLKKLLNWKYSSYYQRLNNKTSLLTKPPVPLPKNYEDFVHTPLTALELEKTRYSVDKGKPYGGEGWSSDMIKKHDLDITTRERGRPRKGT